MGDHGGASEGNKIMPECTGGRGPGAVMRSNSWATRQSAVPRVGSALFSHQLVGPSTAYLVGWSEIGPHAQLASRAESRLLSVLSGFGL